MSARNVYHDLVVRALRADGWTITHDPLTVSYGGIDLFVDLGAERTTIGAQRGDNKIAVEIQSFLNLSQIRDLQQALGQYEMYRMLLRATHSERTLYMAVPQRVHQSLLSQPFGQLIVSEAKFHLLIFDEELGSIIQWIS